MQFSLKSIKIQLAVFLAGFGAYLVVTGNDKDFLLSLLVALALTVAFEALFLFITKKKVTVTECALVTGLILGFVLTADQRNWFGVYLAAACFAIASKHIIRFNGKHIFNPAAFGIVSTMFFFNAQTAWKGTYLWYVLLPAGLYFAYKVRKLELLLGYGVAALGIFAVQALAQGNGLANIFGYLSYFFIAIMLIEPKTTPMTQAGKVAFGVIAAISIFIFNNAGIKCDAELSGLLLANISVPVLNKWKGRQGIKAK
jgi:Na+-translocating ferredoxin:NAD+ oxidoreductase RnfD subunit